MASLAASRLDSGKEESVRVKSAAVAGLAIAVLGVALPASVGAQVTAYEVVNDDPVTRGGPWYPGSQGDGSSDNNFTYTYVQGTENASNEYIDTRASAYWDFHNVPRSRCRVDVYIPSDRATASVYYHVYLGGDYESSTQLQQNRNSGWTELTALELYGSVRIWVLNYSSRGFEPTADSRGYLYNRIAVDAMRLRCEGGRSTGVAAGAGPELGLDTAISRHQQLVDTPMRDGRPWYKGTTDDQNGEFYYSYPRGSKNSHGETITSHSRARWDFTGVPAGSTCDLEAYIPGARATASVHYHIIVNGRHERSVELNQGNQGDWVRLGSLNVAGTVQVYVVNWTWRDLAPELDPRGYGYNRIAVDALRIDCDYPGVPGGTQLTMIPQYPYTADDDGAGFVCGRFDAADRDELGFFQGDCTSYVAFRVNEADSGLEFASGYGDQEWGFAACWSSAAQSAGVPVNGDPARGAVAEWRHQWVADDFGSGAECNERVSSDNLSADKAGRPRQWGHLAYVESVNSDGSIVISDMNFGDSACEVRENHVIRPGDPGWPDGFIHFEEIR